MESLFKEIPYPAMAAFAGFKVFSSLEQMGQRLSKSPERLVSVISSMLKVRVSWPDSSSSMAIPRFFPNQSPWGISLFRARIFSTCPHSASSSFSISARSPVRAFFPFQGVEAWPFSPKASIFI